MFCISVSYKKTPLNIRQKFSFSIDEHKEFIGNLIRENIITGGVIVSTCNRSEIYFSGSRSCSESVIKTLAEYKEINDDDIKKYCLFYGNENAVKHLFNVACGLDSMVLGEDEILRQVKEAYLNVSIWRFADSELNIIFQDALGCAKSEKSSTMLSATPVSIGTIAANLIEDYLFHVQNDVNKKEENEYSVMIIGVTGRIGLIVAKDLLAKGISVIGTSRQHNPELQLCVKDSNRFKVINFAERYLYMNRADVIVSATLSPHYTVTFNEYIEHSNKKHMFIDLAVPYDIDRKLCSLDNIKIYDIDYFENLSKQNTDIKIGEAKKAEKIIEKYVDNTMKKIYVRNFIIRLKEQGEHKEKWFFKMIYYLKKTLDSEQLKSVLDKILNSGD